MAEPGPQGGTLVTKFRTNVLIRNTEHETPRSPHAKAGLTMWLIVIQHCLSWKNCCTGVARGCALTIRRPRGYTVKTQLVSRVNATGHAEKDFPATGSASVYQGFCPQTGSQNRPCRCIVVNEHSITRQNDREDWRELTVSGLVSQYLCHRLDTSR